MALWCGWGRDSDSAGGGHGGGGTDGGRGCSAEG